MPLYRRYLLKQLLQYWTLTTGILTGMLWIIKLPRYLYYLAKYELRLAKFIQLVLLLLPNLLLLTVPFGLAVALPIFHRTIQNRQELIALKTLGLGFHQLLLPFLWLSLVTSTLVAVLVLYLIPKSSRVFLKTMTLLENNLQATLLNQEGFHMFQHTTLRVQRVIGHKLYSFLAQWTDLKTGQQQLLYAVKAQLLSNGHLLLHQGNLQKSFSATPDKLEILFFEKYDVDLKHRYMTTNNKKYRSMDMLYWHQLLALHPKTIAIREEILQRVLMPLFILLITWALGISLLEISPSCALPIWFHSRVIVSYTLGITMFFYALRLAKSNPLPGLGIALLLMGGLVLQIGYKIKKIPYGL